MPQSLHSEENMSSWPLSVDFNHVRACPDWSMTPGNNTTVPQGCPLADCASARNQITRIIRERSNSGSGLINDPLFRASNLEKLGLTFNCRRLSADGRPDSPPVLPLDQQQHHQLIQSLNRISLRDLLLHPVITLTDVDGPMKSSNVMGTDETAAKYLSVPAVPEVKDEPMRPPM